MLLLDTLIDEFPSNTEAFTELNFADVINILSINCFVVFPLEDIKSNLSEKVLCVQFFSGKIFFLYLIKGWFAYPALEYPESPSGTQNESFQISDRNTGTCKDFDGKIKKEVKDKKDNQTS